MEWIKIEDKEPPKESILVWGKCGMPHVSVYDYSEHCHTECCYSSGGHFTGEGIDFTHWMPLPEKPKEKSS